MRFSTSSGWETIATWLVETSMVVAPIRPANCRWASGWSPCGRSSRPLHQGPPRAPPPRPAPRRSLPDRHRGCRAQRLPGALPRRRQRRHRRRPQRPRRDHQPRLADAVFRRPGRVLAGHLLHLREYARHRRPPRTAQRWPAPASHHLRRVPDDPAGDTGDGGGEPVVRRSASSAPRNTQPAHGMPEE